jgi:hypothetical protein
VAGVDENERKIRAPIGGPDALRAPGLQEKYRGPHSGRPQLVENGKDSGRQILARPVGPESHDQDEAVLRPRKTRRIDPVGVAGHDDRAGARTGDGIEIHRLHARLAEILRHEVGKGGMDQTSRRTEHRSQSCHFSQAPR